MDQDTAKFFQAGWEAVHAAGAIIRQAWQLPKTVDYKGAIDLVTSVDRDAERCIVDVLRRTFPAHSILAEEEADFTGSELSYRWIIDPLDGTTNFAHSYPHVSISVALTRGEDLLVGFVYDPLREECFAAIRGEGATMNGQPIRTAVVLELDKALLATGFPYDRREHADYYLTYFKAFLARCQGIRRAGSAALDLCYVACGRIDGFWELKLRPWDVAAGSLIVKEAGGHISDFTGGPFTIWGGETLASNGLIHGEMTEVMREIKASNCD
jgi:myo-inositol-1(or 4)-monophosphatase